MANAIVRTAKDSFKYWHLFTDAIAGPTCGDEMFCYRHFAASLPHSILRPSENRRPARAQTHTEIDTLRKSSSSPRPSLQSQNSRCTNGPFSGLLLGLCFLFFQYSLVLQDVTAADLPCDDDTFFHCFWSNSGWNLPLADLQPCRNFYLTTVAVLPIL